MVSEDTPTQFKVTVCSLFSDPEKTFYEGISEAGVQVDVDRFIALLQRCVAALEHLDQPR